MIIDDLIRDVAAKLTNVPGIVGTVLGGSRARGNYDPSSDIDIGVYYEGNESLSLDELSNVVTELDDESRPNLVAPPGEWGNWVNGGAWVKIDGHHVDIILRNIKRVSSVIDDCLEGFIVPNYHVGHPHAFINLMYMGEIAICKPLTDITGQIEKLKKKALPYSTKVKEAVISKFLFEASFSIQIVKKASTKNDLSYLYGCCFRAISCLNQVIFALNNEYCINEKKAVALVDSFSIKPTHYNDRIMDIFSLLGGNHQRKAQAIKLLDDLFAETEELAEQHALIPFTNEFW